MPLYRYQIKTSNSEADGTIDAENEDEAKQILTEQHVPKEHGFVDEKGNAIEHKLINIELSEVV